VKLVPATLVATGVADSPPVLVPRYTSYPVIGEPPSVTGTAHDSTTDPLPPDATSRDGAAGTVACGVADASLDCGETPAALTAATV
jgi:hypothetical protein